MPQSKKHIINERRHQVAELYLKGWPQHKIAERIKVNQSQVSRDLKYLSQKWQESALNDIDAIKARELAKIDQLERHYFEGWERSIRKQRIEKTKKTKTGRKAAINETAKEEKEMVGDPRFLDGVLKCIAKRAEILGLDSPQKSELTFNPPITGVRLQFDADDRADE